MEKEMNSCWKLLGLLCLFSFFNVPTAEINYIPPEYSCQDDQFVAEACNFDEGNSCANNVSANFSTVGINPNGSDHLCVCSNYAYRVSNDGFSCDRLHCDNFTTDDENFLQRHCGFHVKKCQGEFTNRECTCDNLRHHASRDGRYCFNAPCQADRDIKQKCFAPNRCFGTKTSFICACAYGYRHPGPADLQTCEPKPLTTSDMEKVCGKGAIEPMGAGGYGTYIEPICNCNEALGYVQSADQRKCLPPECAMNSTYIEDCGVENHCIGSYANYTCVCTSPNYKYVDGKCEKRDCGEDLETSKMACGPFATGCSGHIDNPTCSCDNTKNHYPSSDGRSCVIATCSVNPAAISKCGEENSCTGSYDNYICVCDGTGFKNDGNGGCMADCSTDPEVYCGPGATGCLNRGRNRKCVCDEDNDFYPSEDEMSCKKASCRAHPEIGELCGEGGSCFGTTESFICKCSSELGYKLNTTTNQECYLGTCEAGELNHIDLCGVGSLSCTGTMRNYSCECDNSMGYLQSADMTKCVPSDCRGNATMEMQCGQQNSCTGLIDEWRCICDGYGYRPKTNDYYNCEKVMCGDPGIDAVTICGLGATECSGHILNPNCSCDTTNDYIPSPDSRSCIPGSCQNNKAALEACGHENTCTGSYDNYECICDAFGYRLDGNNSRCVEITCDDNDLDIRALCGDGGSSCQGTAKSRVCHCKEDEYYVPSEDSQTCVKESCRGSDKVMRQCGPENSCIGHEESFICICDFEKGYVLDPTTHKACLLATCENGDLDHKIHCGAGSLSCTGNVRNLTCECASGFVPTANGMGCVPNDCRGNSTMREECGEGNDCAGSLDDWICICDAFGYEPMSGTYKQCRKKMCTDADVNHIALCGVGALSCDGPIINPRCICDKTKDYMTSLDGSKCINPKATLCATNSTALEQCGVGNSCTGPANNFICICDTYAYRPDENDAQRCIQRKCDDPDADYEKICGAGAISCTGLITNPVCHCDSAAFYYPNADRTACVFASCKANDTVKDLCGAENDCQGSKESYVCVCNGAGFKRNPDDSKSCLEKTCEENDFDLLTVCGKGALSCSGRLKNLTCECDNTKGFAATALGDHCIPSDCRGNATMVEQCGIGNGCEGSLTDWRCICDSPGYEPHATDITKCHQRSCGDANVDHVMVCGIGAISCTGPILNPRCECDTAAYYEPSIDGSSCIKATCKSNKTALEQCGEGNTCSGSHDNFVCICNYGYRLDGDNNQACVESKCDDPGADYTAICGQGGIGCRGTVRNPVCECDINKHFVPSPDRTSCLLSDCRGNETAMEACGEGNKCFGSASSYICVCDSLGYKPNPANMQECLLRQCETGELDPFDACGKGAESCSGNIESLKCNCDFSMGYVAAPNQRSCVPADCRANATMYKQCGEENGCTGSITDWMCVCDAYGYLPLENDITKCHLQMCSDEGIDLVAVCGIGASSCMGPIRNPICQCDAANHYIPSEDGAACVPASCKTNKTAIEQCGLENSCTGSADNFICICDAFGYRLDDNDNQKCVQKTCSDANRDLVEICGLGAIDCTGTAINPVCECDHTKHYVPSPDRKSCVLASCRTNTTFKDTCGEENSCFGSASSWICHCMDYGYILNPNNLQECIHATCESGHLDPLDVCGKGAVSCKGKWNDYTCQCNNDEGYVSSPDGSSCIPSDCRGNATMTEQCGMENECIGGMTDWLCVCNAPGYLPHADDNMKCVKKMCSDDGFDPVEICGIGAIGCKGSYYNHECECNSSKYYMKSPDGSSCIPASCKNNKAAIQQCGEGNTCSGPFDNFVCICNSFGYSLDDNNNQACTEITCSDPGVNYETICGIGGTNCSGTARNPICECDSSQYFVPSADRTSCLLASCRGNDTLMNNCGDGNSCIGSLTSHTCVCDAKGFKRNPNNFRECIPETCEDDDIDPVLVCGKGAISCNGMLNNITCHCDNDAGFYQSADKTHCVSYGCKQNPNAVEACGEGNTCIGNYNDWFCECTGAGYEPHPTSQLLCVKKNCSDDPIDFCGLGALSCAGEALNPICTCDNSKGYMVSGDRESCVPMDCTFNPNMDCGVGNTCKGSYFSYVCVCSTAGTVRNISNHMECINIECPRDAVMACGEGATGCEVTSTNNVICSCGEGYHPGPYKNTCVLDDCRYNNEATKACGLENHCIGSYNSWMCVCQAPKYTQDPNNAQSCIHAPCRVEDCGSGNAPGSFQNYAESCSGTYFNFNCKCQPEYKLDMLGGCVPRSCKENPDAVAACGENGFCEGTYFQYECRCHKPDYMQNPINPRECIEAPCNVDQCGHGFENELYVNFADSCVGTYKSYTCQCKEGYTGTDTSSCIPDGKECGPNYCHANAICKPLGGNEFDCTCKPGYSGDGLYCFLDGGWSDFIRTKECNASCGVDGYAEVTRYCNNPIKEPRGQSCNAPSPQKLAVPCNRITCSGCTAKKTCQCTTVVKPLFVEGYGEPDEKLEYFTNLNPDDVKKAKDILSEYKAISNKEDLCITFNNKETRNSIYFGIRDSIKIVNKMKESLVEARDIMRIKLDCNVNFEKNEQYFGAYEVIVKRHLLMKQVIHDLKIMTDNFMRHKQDCDQSPVGVLRNILED